MKKEQIKSAIPIYIAAAVWLLAGIVFPKAILKLPGLIVTAVLSVGAYFAGTKLFPGRTVVVEEKISTGNASLDNDIAEGRTRLEKLREANAAIPHPGITANLDRMTKAGEQIFKELGRDPSKASLVRRFMSYYLPTSEKLMDQYRLLMDAPIKGENITSAMNRIESSLDVVAGAFDKCADNLFKDDEMDIDAEIKVMKTMLTGDNLVESATNSILRAAGKLKDDGAPAAAEQAVAAVEQAAAPAEQAAPDGEMELEGKDRKITLTLGR
ncbi:MAG: 5-bromo-4-chloroindolyl phosphate hydrolysis family protein [Clostridia bacterium]|nr:5-bromo-4-chloroindolyl phosphate hydrolysis family protein [Clostridia bacterium]